MTVALIGKDVAVADLGYRDLDSRRALVRPTDTTTRAP